jgi:hypothetical protein
VKGLVLAALGVIALAVPAGTAFARSSAGPTVLADCLGKPQVKPADVILACGDGNSELSSMKWTGWGSAFTAGTGIVTINDCKPDCVDGTDHDYPVVVVLTGRQTCKPSGKIAYVKLTLAFLDTKSHTSGSQTFPCVLR